MPEPGSALESASRQGRGTTVDERDQTDVSKHRHDGADSENINIADLEGFIRTVSAVPTWTPTVFSEQMVVYKNGATIRFYIYDTLNKAWRYTALT